MVTIVNGDEINLVSGGEKKACKCLTRVSSVMITHTHLHVTATGCELWCCANTGLSWSLIICEFYDLNLVPSGALVVGGNCTSSIDRTQASVKMGVS